MAFILESTAIGDRFRIEIYQAGYTKSDEIHNTVVERCVFSTYSEAKERLRLWRENWSNSSNSDFYDKTAPVDRV
jgi:hypothetical protein